ncbi:MAG: hypothetical protein H6766_04900 [Candidatus Peribacteria bacterium]|nr:MAG: hypothetical protein H6766_04900 [Candidatus Peribacteria bacterium]
MKTTEADIITALKAQYPKTPGDKISSFASDLHQMLVHFDATAWKDENDKDKDLFTEQEKSNAFGRIQEIIADHFAQQFWNENVEKIAK